MNKKDETLKDLMIVLDTTYQTDRDRLKIKEILETNGYEIKYRFIDSWFIQLGDTKFLRIEFNKPKGKRYFHLEIKETKNPVIDELMKQSVNHKESKQEQVKPIYDKTYMTTQNGISKLLTLKERTTKEILKDLKEISNESTNDTNTLQIKTPRDELWKKIIERERLNTNELEHHLVINPKIENYSSQKLFSIFKDEMAKFYRRKDVLNRHFNKHKDKQMMVYITLEYGSKDIRPDEKGTHFHILLKSKTQEMLDKFHPFMEKHIKEKIGEDTNYHYSPIDTPEYRINLYNYFSKEDREVWTNNDLYRSKNEGIYMDKYDKILLKTCHTVDYDEVFRKRTEEAKREWEKYLQDKMNQPIQIQQNNDSNYEEYLTF